LALAVFEIKLFLKKPNKQKTKLLTWRWWLMPIILPTWETEIGRIMIGGQPGQITRENPSPNLPEQNGLVVWHKQ
jgi:hypothetical protein